MEVSCLFCRKQFVIDSSDPQYFRLKYKQTNHYICKSCNRNMQNEAKSNVDYDPSVIDSKGYDKLI